MEAHNIPAGVVPPDARCLPSPVRPCARRCGSLRAQAKGKKGGGGKGKGAGGKKLKGVKFQEEGGDDEGGSSGKQGSPQGSPARSKASAGSGGSQGGASSGAGAATQGAAAALTAGMARWAPPLPLQKASVSASLPLRLSGQPRAARSVSMALAARAVWRACSGGTPPEQSRACATHPHSQPRPACRPRPQAELGPPQVPAAAAARAGRAGRGARADLLRNAAPRRLPAG